MTQPTRADAYRAALAKTAGRRFGANGELILTTMEATTLRVAEAMDANDAEERRRWIEAELERLEALDATVS